MDTARQSDSGADDRSETGRGRPRRSYRPSDPVVDESPEDLIARNMRKAVVGTDSDDALDTPIRSAPHPLQRGGLDDIAPVYRANPLAGRGSTMSRPVDADGRPSILWIAVALAAVGLLFVTYQCASTSGDPLASGDGTPAESSGAAGEDSDTGDDAANATTPDVADDEESSDAGATDASANGDDAKNGAATDGSGTAGAATAGTEADDGAPTDEAGNTASTDGTEGTEGTGSSADGTGVSGGGNDLAGSSGAPASAASIAATLDAGLDSWRIDEPSSTGARRAPAAVAGADGDIWAVSEGELLRYNPSEDTWAPTADTNVEPLSIVDLDENGGTVRGLLGAGERAPGIATWALDEGEDDNDDGEGGAFTWQFFELPEDAPMPDLLATSQTGASIVARSDLDLLDGPISRNEDASRILRDGGIDLETKWIAGADIDGITYIDPSVPVADWTTALLTRSAWSTFGIEPPDSWLAYRPETSDRQRTLQYVTVETVIDVPDPFGPDEFLLDLQGTETGFEATTWNGSSVFGPTRWTSSDGRSWTRRDATPISHRGAIAASNGGHVRAGDHEYRIRSLGRQSIVEYRERGADLWEIRPIDDLAPGLGGAWRPVQVRVGPAGLVIVVDIDDPSASADVPSTVLLLSRDGTSFASIDPGIDVVDVHIATTYLVAFDDDGGAIRLDPTS